MRIVIAGAGKYGRTIAGELVAEGHDITMIERDEESLDRAIETYDLSGLVGNAASYEIQKQAGVDSCQAFLAMTGSDEINLISAIMAQKQGAQKTLARVVNPDYSPDSFFFRQALGIGVLVNPNLESARKILQMLQYPSATSVDSFFGGRVQIVAVRVPADSLLAGLKLLDFRHVCGQDLMVCVIQRDGQVIIPDGTSQILAGDTLHVTGETDTLQAFYARTNTMVPAIRHVLITGGGAIAYWLLGLINRKRFTIRLIERDRAMADLVYQHYPWLDIIRADGTDQQVLEECNIQNYDAFISLTGIDEEHVLASMAAARSGGPKSVTKVNRTRILGLLAEGELQNILTPQQIVADEVVRDIRALDNSQGSQVEALYRLAEGQVEALEFIARPQSRVLGQTLLELDLRPSLRLVCLVRGREIIFPSGKDQIQAGDRVIVVASGIRLQDLDDILGGRA